MSEQDVGHEPHAVEGGEKQAERLSADRDAGEHEDACERRDEGGQVAHSPHSGDREDDGVRRTRWR
jgi:hypothetical protein